MTAVTVIGAGPAGALAAALLAKRGVDIVLVDKATFPRAKVCGCCLSPTALRALRAAGYEHIVSELAAVPLNEMRLFNGKRMVKLTIKNSVAVSRSALDNKLIEIAREEGARFLPGTNAVIGKPNQFGRQVILGGHTAVSKIVLAADGLSGTSLKREPASNLTISPSSKVGIGAVSSRGEQYDAGVIYMCTGDGGYVGLVRLENGQLDIAAAIDPSFPRKHKTPAQAVANLIESARLPIPSDYFELEWRGTTPLTRQRARVATERLFLIGDSASYVEPFTGEGIAWAYLSALNVVPLVDRATRIWHESLSSQWQHIYESEIRSRQIKTEILSKVLKSNLVRSVGAEVLARVPAISSLLVEAIHA